jgi:uncharacterized damage-inducible protein DinB
MAELLVHMAHWKDVVRRRLEGDPVADANEGDWPAIPDGSVTFAELRLRLDAAQARLLERVAALTDAELDAPVAGNDLTREAIVHGVLEHDVYHTGQLALLVRAFRTR